jgi:hypothetical protein
LSSNNSLFSCGWREWYYHIREFIIARPTILQSTCWLGVYIYLSFSFSLSPHLTSPPMGNQKRNSIPNALFSYSFEVHFLDMNLSSLVAQSQTSIFCFLCWDYLHWIQLLEVLPY